MRKRPHRFGMHNTANEPGCDVSHENPRGPGIITPTLLSWNYVSQDMGVVFSRVTFYNNETSGTPCEIKFILRDGKVTFVSSLSTGGDENYPHFGCIVDVDGIHRNKWYDLEWSWRIAGGPLDPWEVLLTDVIWVPGWGGSPGSGGGDL